MGLLNPDTGEHQTIFQFKDADIKTITDVDLQNDQLIITNNTSGLFRFHLPYHLLHLIPAPQ